MDIDIHVYNGFQHATLSEWVHSSIYNIPHEQMHGTAISAVGDVCIVYHHCQAGAAMAWTGNMTDGH